MTSRSVTRNKGLSEGKWWRAVLSLLVMLACLATIFDSVGLGRGVKIPEVGDDQRVVLLSITFPASTDLTGATTTPPAAAPLAQQVVFTFSNPPDVPATTVVASPPGYEALQICADPGPGYDGPLCVLDTATNTIPARGTYELRGRSVIFTPSFPRLPIDLGRNAVLEAVPGLLPDMDYTVFVPVGTSVSIPNLQSIRPQVVNPVTFSTCREDLVNLYYANHPARPPTVTASNPEDGAFNVPINTLADQIPGFPLQEEFYLEFDEPLHYSLANVQGQDIDGDGVVEESMFYLYDRNLLFAALDRTATGDPSIVAIDRKTGEDRLVGTTRLAQPPYTKIGLRGVVINRSGAMWGTSGDTLYNVEYEDPAQPGVCRLFEPRPLGSSSDVRGLTLAPDGTLYALDGLAGDLLSIDPQSGGVTVLAYLDPGYGVYLDLAVRLDGALFGLAVNGAGGPSAFSSLVRIDPATGSTSLIDSRSGDVASIGLAGFAWIALYEAQQRVVEIVDTITGQPVAGAGYGLIGLAVPVGARLDIQPRLAELGCFATLVENSWQGARVVLEPSGILPMGERVETLVRRGLANISLGSLARNVGHHPAEADFAAAFTTFDPGPMSVQDVFLEDFLSFEGEASTRDYIQAGLTPAQWNVQDVNGQPPDYAHLLAAHGLAGGGSLGDFVPLGVQPAIYLDTDSQLLPLPDGSTPDILVPTVVEGGVFEFHNILIPDGVTVLGSGSNPLVLTATGRIEIAGRIDVSGEAAADDVTFDTAFIPNPGGHGGPGGGAGGVSNPQVPPDFQQLIDLRSPFKGEDGWGYSGLSYSGGRGGEGGAKGTDVRYMGGSSGEDPESRGSGGGGGTLLQRGGRGYHGLGRFGADPTDPLRYFVRDLWAWYDGHPSPVPGVNYYATQHPPGGDPGEAVFRDANSGNDFMGAKGEVTFLHGGQGGGGGGSRLDSLNPATAYLAAQWAPPVDRSAYDAKGGGGGGGGGALGLYALESIEIAATGALLAQGGDGGGGEVIGHSNYGGGGGGGSGGAVILDSTETITIRSGALIDVSGGWPGEAKEVTKFTLKPLSDNPCLNGGAAYHKASFCNWSVGDGGYGGHGIVQLQVPDWTTDLVVEDPASIVATLCEVDWTGPICTGKNSITNPHCGCTEGGNNCAFKYHHYKVHYDAQDNPSLPMTQDCLVDPAKTPTTLGPLSYGLSRWIDMGQVTERPPVGGIPAPRFLGFLGIDASGVVITQNGYIPNPELNDIEVDAPDLGLEDYIPAENEVAILFQGARALVPGSKATDPASFTSWTADITSLSGYQFVRFRIALDTAHGVPLTATNPKPQVNIVKIRVEY